MPLSRMPQRIALTSLTALTCGLATPAARAAVDFEKNVVPILKAKCYDCHTGKKTEADKKPKGGLALDTTSGILAGKVVEPGNLDESSLYSRVILPQSDDDVMPPKKDGTPLTPAEIAALKEWILEGAHFGKAGAAPTGPVKQMTLDEVKALGLKDPNPDGVRALTELGATVTPISVTTPQLLAVEFISGASLIGDDEVKQLMAIAPNVVELNLARTNVTDEGLKSVGAFARLTKLNLNNTKITDAGLESLVGLTSLDWLNLYGTAVSDAGLASIAKLRNLKAVYLWNSKVTDEGVAKLQKALGSTKVVDKVWSESSRFDLEEL
jgi:hypothetical protein